MNQEGELIMAEYDKLLSEKTKIVATIHISNALGTINPIKYMIDQAHAYGAADRWSASCFPFTNMQELDCDFMFFRT
jgi:cysteine desulfurase/selenocysteine lyase